MIQSKKNKSTGFVESSGWLFIRMMVMLILGCFTSVICVIFIFLIMGQSHGLDWFELLQKHYQEISDHIQPNCLLVIIQKLNSLIDQADKIVLIPDKPSLIRVSLQAKQSIDVEFVFYVKIILISLKISIARLGLLFHWSILFLMLWLIGLVDGFTQRSIRRSQVRRESALTYHHAKKSITFSLLLGLFLIIALPLSIQILEWIVVFFAVWFSLSVFMTTESFKKYL